MVFQLGCFPVMFALQRNQVWKGEKSAWPSDPPASQELLDGPKRTGDDCRLWWLLRDVDAL